MKVVLSTFTALIMMTAPAQAAPPCGPAGSRTIAAGSLTRIFVQKGKYLVCTRGYRTEILFSRLPRDTPTELRVRGRYVGVVGVGAPYVFDARDKRRTVPSLGEYRPGVTPEIRGWALSANGGMVTSTAFAAYPPVPYPVRPENREIRRSAGCGREILDAGPDVDPDSLRVVGATIAWRRGGRERSAPACPSGAISRRVCALGSNEGVVGLNRSAAMIESYRDDNDDYVRTSVCQGKRRTRIAETYDSSFYGSGVESLTSAGPWFAWSDESCWKECIGNTVTALNARTGVRHRIHRFFEQAQVAVNRAGVVAAGFYAYDSPTQVTVWTPGGAVDIAKEDVEPFSLQLTSRAVQWRLDGTRRSVPLP